MKIECGDPIKVSPTASYIPMVCIDKTFVRNKIEKVLRKWDVSGNFYRDADFEKLLNECVEDL